MTLATGSGVLQRMIQPQHPPAAPDVPLTASRAVRLAVARAAQTGTGLKLTVGHVGEQALPLDDLLAAYHDDLLLMALTRDGGVCGIIGCDMGLVSAAIEVMTTGKVSAAPPDQRRVTRTEGTLVQPLLRDIMDELEETTARTALDGWTRHIGLGVRLDSCRAAGFALADQTYRLMRLTLDCGAEDRTGQLLLALPLHAGASVALHPTGPTAPVADWQTRFQTAVLAAPARLDAVLHRMKVPLSTLTGLDVGDCLPLLGCTLGMVRVEDPNGRVVARGRLGQIAGQIAVRIQSAEVIPMTDMAGASDDPPRPFRTRASDYDSPQFDIAAAEVEALDWNAAPLPLDL